MQKDLSKEVILCYRLKVEDYSIDSSNVEIVNLLQKVCQIFIEKRIDLFFGVYYW